MKLAKMILTGSVLFVPALAMGIAQQDPNTQQQNLQQQNLQQNQQQKLQQDAAHMATAKDVVGVIAEVRGDSFSVRKDADQSVLWFTITPELKSSASAELVTGNHVRVNGMPEDSGDRWMAHSVKAEADGQTADVTVDTDTDLDRDTTIADTDSDLRDDDDEYDTDDDSDELPRTASSLPAIGSLGLLALLGAAAVASARKF